MTMIKKTKQEIKDAVRKHYGDAITQKTGSCCSPPLINLDSASPAEYARLAGYSSEDLAGLPEGVTTFGCGNPLALAGIHPGETVLDLGSGAGLDLILAARKVGPSGKVIGLDMTPAMIETCRTNLMKAGVTNAEVREGEMEAMPVRDHEVDWIISNCVINLSPDKKRVFAEAFRVLKPGGQMLVSDIVTNNLPDQYRDNICAWVGCLAGAVEEPLYVQMVRDAGFEDVRVIEKMTYDKNTLSILAQDSCCGSASDQIDAETIAQYANRVASVKLHARRPQ